MYARNRLLLLYESMVWPTTPSFKRFGGISHSFCLFSIFFLTIHSFLHPFSEGPLVLLWTKSTRNVFPLYTQPTRNNSPLTSEQKHYFLIKISRSLTVPRRLFFAAPQRIAVTSSPKYYQKMQRSITRKNQEEHGPEVK